ALWPGPRLPGGNARCLADSVWRLSVRDPHRLERQGGHGGCSRLRDLRLSSRESRSAQQSKVCGPEYAVDGMVAQRMIDGGHRQVAGAVHSAPCASTVPSPGRGAAPVSNESMASESRDSSSFFLSRLLARATGRPPQHMQVGSASVGNESQVLPARV